ncbi:MAG: amino acid ABC transporter permease [Deltaproteobacteria bacterium]
MHRRAGFMSVGLLAALLALVLTALTPVALATDAASPSPGTQAAAAPQGTPIVLGVIPDPSGTRTKWSGDQININLDLNGADLDAAASVLTVDGEEIALSEPASMIELSPGNPTLQMKWSEPTFAQGDFKFQVTLFDTAGNQLQVYDERTDKTSDVYAWEFASEGGASGGSLINFEVMQEWFWYIAAGAIVTVELTIISILLACVFALFGSLGRLSKKMTFKQAWDRYQSREYMFRMVIGRIPYWLATFYTSLFRGTPLLLQIIVIYQGVPEFIRAFGLPDTYNPPAFWSGVAALSLNYGAYLTEVFRAGIQAVPKGQNEAAWAIGLSGWQTQRRIILPQAFKIVIPAVGNDFIALIKDTSLVSVITVEELLRRAQLAGASSLNNFSTLLVAAAFYWALTIFFSFWQAKLETRMARDKAREKEKGKAK